MVTYIDIHTHSTEVSENIVLYNLKSNETPDYKYFTYGIHPWEISKNTWDSIFDKLTYFCRQGLISAIGEIGIDRAIEYPVNEQIKFFELQHAIAEKYNLPVIIHCVRAWSDLLAIKKRIKPTVPWIFHGYNGNVLTALQLIKNGCYVSFGQHIIQSIKVQEVFKALPLEKMFLETDDSLEKIEHIYDKAADLRPISILDLQMQLEENFDRVFIKK